MTSAIREKTLHRLFLISVWLKGGAGLLETLAGAPFLFVTPRAIEDFVVLLTAPELSEDPNDCIATTIRRAVHHFSADTALFAGAYLVIHGLIKIFFGRRSLAGKIVGIPDLALVSGRVHRLPMLSVHVHPLDLAYSTNGSRCDRGVFDLARVSVAQTVLCAVNCEAKTRPRSRTVRSPRDSDRTLLSIRP
jgi:Predicted membrane protein (DUF2127)